MEMKIWLMLSIACAALASASSGPVVWSSGRVTQESDMIVNGQFLHERRESDDRCRHVRTTTTQQDGTSSTVDDDYETGVEVIVLSSNDTACYVHVLPEEDRRDTPACTNGGGRSRSEDQADEEEERLEEGEEEDYDQQQLWDMLSPEQREQCQGRTLKLLRDPKPDAGGSAADRHKRATRCFLVIRRYWRCDRVTRMCHLIYIQAFIVCRP